MNHLINELALLVGGLIAGILAGLLGSGGGFLTVPLMLAFNYSPIQTIGTTGLAVSITAISGSIQNSYMGYFSLKRVLSIGIPALVATQVSVHIANKIEPYVLLAVCGVLMLLMIYLVELRRQLIERAKQVTTESVTEAPATEEPVEPVKSLTPIKPIAIVGDYRKTVPSLFDQQIRRIAYADKPTVYAVEEPTVHSKRSLPHWLTSLTARRMTVGSLAGLFGWRRSRVSVGSYANVAFGRNHQSGYSDEYWGQYYYLHFVLDQPCFTWKCLVCRRIYVGNRWFRGCSNRNTFPSQITRSVC
jgi:uncharacterized membrane protein YfcA